jgi:hypothetical protein
MNPDQDRADKFRDVPERRKEGWTLWKEIYGTIIGAAAVFVPIAIGVVTYFSKQVERIDVHDSKIIAIEKIDAIRETQRLERAGELDKRLMRMEGSQDRIEATLQRLVERPR